MIQMALVMNSAKYFLVPDGCLKDWDARHPTKLANPPNELHDAVVPSQSLHEDLTFLNPSCKISCIMPIKQAMVSFFISFQFVYHPYVEIKCLFTKRVIFPAGGYN